MLDVARGGEWLVPPAVEEVLFQLKAFAWLSPENCLGSDLADLAQFMMSGF